MIHDNLAGMARLKAAPLRWRIVFALFAAAADDEPAQVSLRSLAEFTGVGAERQNEVAREATALVRIGILDRLSGRGSAATVYRLRAPDDWPHDAWRGDRRDGLAGIAIFAEARAAAKVNILARKSRGQRPVIRADSARAGRRLYARIPREQEGASSRGIRASGDADGDRSLLLTERDISLSLERERESVRPQRLSERAETLVAAVEAACGTTLAGAPLRRLAAIADASNGEFSALLDLARAPGLRSFNARIEALERLAAGNVTPEREHVRSDPRRRKLESSIRGAELAGDDELASELRAQLANLADREHEGGRQDAS